MIKEVNKIKDVVNGSFGWFNQSQILLCSEENPHDYADLTSYFLKRNKTALTNSSSVSIDQILESTGDLSLSNQSHQAALRLYDDISCIMQLTDKWGLYAQNIAFENEASQWHFDKDERAIIEVYHGVKTQIALPKDTLEQEQDLNLGLGFVRCRVKPDSTPIEIEQKRMFAMAGFSRLIGKPTGHRKGPADGDTRLILIAEP